MVSEAGCGESTTPIAYRHRNPVTHRDRKDQRRDKRQDDDRPECAGQLRVALAGVLTSTSVRCHGQVLPLLSGWHECATTGSRSRFRGPVQ